MASRTEQAKQTLYPAVHMDGSPHSLQPPPHNQKMRRVNELELPGCSRDGYARSSVSHLSSASTSSTSYTSFFKYCLTVSEKNIR